MQGDGFESANLKVRASLFGGNILSTADRVGDGTFDEKVKALGITALRYPGGSLTEDFFDIRNPDSALATSSSNRVTELMPLSDFISYANNQGTPVVLVVPTRYALTAGSYGQRNIDRSYLDDLFGFVSDVLKGKYGFADIEAFEVGNEYWGSGQMSSREYGMVASAFSLTIQRAIDAHKALLPSTVRFDEPQIAVQIGQRGQSETLNGNELNRIVMAEFNAAEAAAVDAVVAHYYTDVHPTEFLKNDNRFNRMKAWEANPAFGNLNLLVTEWNVASPNSSQLGVRQPASLIAMFTEMVYEGVDGAFVWPIQQNTKNDLAGREGSVSLTLGGEAFRLMSEVLTDATLLGRRVNSDSGLYLFQKNSEYIVYLASHKDTDQEIQVDLAQWASTEAQVSLITVKPETTNSSAEPKPVVTSSVETMQNGSITVTLAPHALTRLIVVGPADPSPQGPRIVGTPGQDALLGTKFSEVILGLSGDDRIDAGDGNDTVLGGAGADRVALGNGNDFYGKDVFAFELEGDRVLGQNGFDLILGAAGADTLDGGQGADTLIGAAGKDSLAGGAGADLLHGGSDDDTLSGGMGNDVLIGGVGADTFEFSSAGGIDKIRDMGAEDLIDLRALALGRTGFQAFRDRYEVSDGDDLTLSFHDHGTTVVIVGRDHLTDDLFRQFLL